MLSAPQPDQRQPNYHSITANNVLTESLFQSVRPNFFCWFNPNFYKVEKWNRDGRDRHRAHSDLSRAHVLDDSRGQRLRPLFGRSWYLAPRSTLGGMTDSPTALCWLATVAGHGSVGLGTADLGGSDAVSEAERSIARRAAVLTVECENVHCCRSGDLEFAFPAR